MGGLQVATELKAKLSGKTGFSGYTVGGDGPYVGPAVAWIYYETHWVTSGFSAGGS